DSSPASNMEQLREKPAPLTTVDLLAGAMVGIWGLYLHFSSRFLSMVEGPGTLFFVAGLVVVLLGYAVFLSCRSRLISLFVEELAESGIAEKFVADTDFAFEYRDKVPSLLAQALFGARDTNIHTA